MKTFNNLTPSEVSTVNAIIAVDHNLKVINSVIHSALHSCNRNHRLIPLLTEKFFSMLDDYIMQHSGDFNESFFKQYSKEIHPYENETQDTTC